MEEMPLSEGRSPYPVPPAKAASAHPLTKKQISQLSCPKCNEGHISRAARGLDVIAFARAVTLSCGRPWRAKS